MDKQTLATAIGAFVSYALVVAFWLVGAAAMAAFALRGGAEAARRSLEELAPEPPVSVAGGRA